MKRRDFIAVLSAPTFAWGLGACGLINRPPPLRLAAHAFPGYEFLFLARQLEVFAADTVRLVETPSAGVSSHALLQGMVEAAALTLDEVLTLLNKGLDLAVVLMFNHSAGADMLLGRSALRALADLRGARVGVEVGAVGALMLDAALEAANLSVKDIVLVPLPADRHLAAWNNLEVDALVSFDPTASILRAMGARLLFDSRQIPGRIVDVLAVRREALATHGAALQQLVAAHFMAQGHYAVHGPADAERMAPRSMAAADFAGLHLSTLSENREALSLPSRRLEAIAGELAERMVARGLLPRRPELGTVFDAAYLPAI